jgi:hypothetical protein
MNAFEWDKKINPDLLEKIQQSTNALAKVDLNGNPDEKISILAKTLEPFIQIIEKTLPLSKLFLNWLGNKKIRRVTGELDSQLIATHLLKNVLINESNSKWSKMISDLQKDISIYSKTILSSHTDPNNIPVHLKGIKIENLDRKTKKWYHGILSTLVFIDEFKDNESENIKKIIQELKIWCLQYLVVAAKPPLFNSDKDCGDLAYSEYLHDNEPHYHREDGGAIVDLFTKKLQEKHPWLQIISIGLIKNYQFSTLINQCCDLFQNNNQSNPRIVVNFLEIDPLIEEIKIITNKNQTFLFLDFSPYIQSKFDDKKINPTDQEANPITKVDKFVEDLSKNEKLSNINLIYGASANLNKQDFYYFKSSKNKILAEFENKFKTLQGSHGAYPEIMWLKRYLIELGFDVKTLLDAYPVEERKAIEGYLKIKPIYYPDYTKNDVEEARQKLFNDLTLMKTSKDETISHFSSFLLYFLDGMPRVLIVDHPRFCGNVISRYEKIRKVMNHMHSTGSSINLNFFQQHIQNLFIYFKSSDNQSLSILINGLKPTVSNDIQKFTITRTSGIACYRVIVDLLLKLYASKRPKATFDKKSYYELVKGEGSLRECMQSLFECSTKYLSDYETIVGIEEQDIIFLDHCPNRVVYQEVKKLDIEKIIKYLLKRRRDKSIDSPLTIVLDCATSFFMLDEIQQLLKNLTWAIKSGELIMVLANSFAKYLSNGGDQFPGGMAQFYWSAKLNKDKEIQTYLKEISGHDSFSVEAERTFYIILKNCHLHVQAYLEMIQKNTNIVYDILEKNGLVIKEILKINDPRPFKFPIQVGYRSPEIPMIGLHFHSINTFLFEGNASKATLHVIVLIMQYYLFANFIEEELPVSMKQSFGYFHSNLNECWIALRWTVGLEERDLEKYTDIILRENTKLLKVITDNKESLAKKIKPLSELEQLKKKIYKTHVILIDQAKKGLDHLVDYLYEMNCHVKERTDEAMASPVKC